MTLKTIDVTFLHKNQSSHRLISKRSSSTRQGSQAYARLEALGLALQPQDCSVLHLQPGSSSLGLQRLVGLLLLLHLLTEERETTQLYLNLQQLQSAVQEGGGEGKRERQSERETKTGKQ